MNWLTGYADGGVRLDDDNLLWLSGLLTQGVPEYPLVGEWGSHRTSSWQSIEDPLDPLQIGKLPFRKRSYTTATARTFGSKL